MSPGAHFTMILLTSILGDIRSDVILNSALKTLMSIPRKPCHIPSSNQYYYFSLEGDRLNPNYSIDGSGKLMVNVKCFDPDRVIKPDFAVCFDGKLYPSQHTCVQKKCNPILDQYSTLYTCTPPKGVEGNCVKPAEPGTKVTIRCASRRYTYIKDGNMKREKFCLKSGEWEELDDCEAKCGLDLNKNFSGYNNSSSKILNEYFWHAVIFRYKDGEWDQLCEGTVISSFRVITAHNCFQGDWIDLGPLKVGVGKYSRNYRNYASSRVYNVEKIQSGRSKPPTIVLLTVDKYIAFSDKVGYICIGWPTMNIKLDERIGHIVAWTKDDKNSALQVAKSLQWATNEECRSSKEIGGKIRADDFCSLSNNHTFLPNEIGAGLVFLNKPDGYYYLCGLLSALFFDGKIPVFMNFTNKLSTMFLQEEVKKSNKAIKMKNKNWYIKRKDDFE